MHMRAFIGIAFVLNLLLSNVCLLGTAYAATPTDGGETLLSREVPMSFNVVTCTWVRTDDGWEPTPDSPCASGQCVKKAPPETRCLFGATVPHVPIATPASFPAIAMTTHEPWSSHEPRIDTSPPYPGLSTIVLRT